MSCDIYAKPDLSKKVRYNRKVHEDEVKWEEREVDIYESADAIGHDHTDIQSHEGGPHNEKHPEAVHRRRFTAVVLCVGVLCCLMLIGIIIIIHFTAQLQNNYSQLQETISDISVNNSQLKSSYETLSKNYSQLQAEIKQLTDKIADMAVNNSQLQDEIKQLKSKIEGKRCPAGWKRSGCSCYFKSNEKKTWYNSRSDCQSKGADLVVINNKEEQKFLTELNVHGEFWIGLRATKGKWNNGRQVWEWEWVDKSPLTEMFWESGPPQYSAYQDTPVVAYCNQQGRLTLTDRQYYDSNHWICEKKISCILDD